MTNKLVRLLTHKEVIELYSYKDDEKWEMESYAEQDDLEEFVDIHPPGTCPNCWHPNDWSRIYPDLTDDTICNDCAWLEEQAQMLMDWTLGRGYV